MLPLPGGAGLSPVSLGAPRLAEFSAPGAAFRGLELSRLVWVLLDVLSGLRALHEVQFEGVAFVHGAVSPQYILLGEQGGSRLVPLTNAHLMPNPPSEPGGYIAPELLLGEPGDRRADLFSVGVLLWEALAEYRLFPDGSRAAVLDRLDGGEVPALAGLVQASWALPLCRVAERAIAVAPSARFANALEFGSAIVAAAGRQLTSPPSERRAPSMETAAFVPSARPARRRSVTPPATVIDLAPAPAWTEPDSVTHLLPPSPSFQLFEPDWTIPVQLPPSAPQQLVPRVRRIPGYAAWLGAGVVAAAAWLVLTIKNTPPVARQPMATLNAPEPTHAAKATQVSPSLSAAAAAPSSVRSAAAATSAAPRAERKPDPQNPAAPQRRPTAFHRPDSDYGI